jgi:hypothetical protein
VGYFISSFFGQADSVIEMSGLANYYIKPYFILIGIGLLIGVCIEFYTWGIGNGNWIFNFEYFISTLRI